MASLAVALPCSAQEPALSPAQIPAPQSTQTPAPEPALKPVNERPKVLYLSNQSSDNHYGQMISLASQAAAEQLGFDLSIAYYDPQSAPASLADIRYLLRFAPDYIITRYRFHSLQLLSIAQEMGIKVLLTSSELGPEALERIGQPREKFANWLGLVKNNDRQAGQLLAQHLGAAQEQQEGAKQAQRFIAFNGAKITAVARDRRLGLYDYAHANNAQIEYTFDSHWQPQRATQHLLTALAQYPDATLLWAASDDIALELIKKLKATDQFSSRDYLIGGIDWTPKALDAIERGELVTSLGGLHISFACALVLLYDYHHGYDFAEYGLSQMINFHAIDQSNIKRLRPLLSRQSYFKMDFKRLSQRHNPNFDGYEFDIKHLFQGLKQEPDVKLGADN